jgi:hypothetical protein
MFVEVASGATLEMALRPRLFMESMFAGAGMAGDPAEVALAAAFGAALGTSHAPRARMAGRGSEMTLGAPFAAAGPMGRRAPETALWRRGASLSAAATE